MTVCACLFVIFAITIGVVGRIVDVRGALILRA